MAYCFVNLCGWRFSLSFKLLIGLGSSCPNTDKDFSKQGSIFAHRVPHFTCCAWFKETLPYSHNFPPKLVYFVCVRLFLWSCSLFSVCCALEKPSQLPAGQWHPARLPLPLEGKICQPAPLTSEEPVPPSILLHKTNHILCWLSGNFTALHLCLHLLQVPLLSLFWNVLSKAVWRGLFSLTWFVCTLGCDERLLAMFV